MYRSHLSGLLLTTLWGLHTSLVQAAQVSVEVTTPEAQPAKEDFNWDTWENTTADTIVAIKQSESSSGAPSILYSQAIAGGNGEKEKVEGTYGTSSLKTDGQGMVYTTTITFGDQEFNVVIDTGSSDTWIVENNFTCKHSPNQADCDFGPTYTRSSTFTPINDQNFAISYADERYLNGVFGNEKVTLAGITVNGAQVALVDEAGWSGDGIASGILGLGFPANTRAFKGTDEKANTEASQIPYYPLFTAMYVEGSVPQILSLALERDGTGQLAIGGTPDVDYEPIFASSSFQLLTTAGVALDETHYTFYTITTNGFQYKGAQDGWSAGNWLTNFGAPNDPTQVQVVIDSGTTINYLPYSIANAVNMLFEPVAQFNALDKLYHVNCNAKAPRFGVKIGLEIFYINPVDMIVKTKGNQCYTAVTSAGEGGVSILGHAFLKNVVAVFDVGASKMRFAARENYN